MVVDVFDQFRLAANGRVCAAKVGQVLGEPIYLFQERRLFVLDLCQLYLEILGFCNDYVSPFGQPYVPLCIAAAGSCLGQHPPELVVLFSQAARALLELKPLLVEFYYLP